MASEKGFSATADFLRYNGAVVASIKGWWDAQMIFEELTFKSAEGKQLWEDFCKEHRFQKATFDPSVMLDIREGGVLYLLIHKRL